MNAIGLDLAWSGRYPSGWCHLHRDGAGWRIVALWARLAEDSWWTDLDGPTLMAVDAPLVCEVGRRAEAELGREFGKYKASAYVASPDFLNRNGLTAGPELAARLVAANWSLNPNQISKHPKVAVEVFPHAIHVAKFGLAERIRYKKGRIADRVEGLRTYITHLQEWIRREVPSVESDPLLASLWTKHPRTGAAMKDLEDRLDALTCALYAASLLDDRAQPRHVFGDVETGYILSPTIDVTKSQPLYPRSTR